VVVGGQLARPSIFRADNEATHADEFLQLPSISYFWLIWSA
jgi:hypothetical protein